MVLPFQEALDVFLIIWSMLPSPIRTFSVVVLVVWILIGFLDILTNRT